MSGAKVVRIRKRRAEEIAEEFATDAPGFSYFVGLSESDTGEVFVYVDDDQDIYAVVGRMQALIHALLNQAQTGDEE